MAVDLVVCVATELEGSLLRPHVPVLRTGVGAVNAAYTLTRFLEREQARAVIVCGIAGAYPNALQRGVEYRQRGVRGKRVLRRSGRAFRERVPRHAKPPVSL